MVLDLLTGVNVQQGLKELLDKAYSIRENLTARVQMPVLEDGTELWKTWLDSKTMNLYGGVNEDNRHRFKIDHEFDLSRIVNANINPDSSIPTDETAYAQSQGTEFIIIPQTDIKEAKTDYAIRADKYQGIRERLSKRACTAEDLEKAGGFKINEWLTPEEAQNDGWLELAVGKNKASEEEYQKASRLLKTYISRAQENRCFRDGTGMGFYVSTNVDSFKVRPWCVYDSDGRSVAYGMYFFGADGHFLRVRDKVGEADTQKTDYDTALKVVLGQPIRNNQEASAISGKLTEYLQAKQ